MSATPHLHSHKHAPESSKRTLLLRCPRCGSTLGPVVQGIPLFESGITCEQCSFVLEHDRGIWLALPPERKRHYESFLTDYQIVRATEGRGSSDAAFYLALPYRDTTGRNQAQWSIRGQSYRYIERELLPALNPSRSGLDILDLGAGNGWLSYRLATQDHRPVAVDLLLNNTDGLGAASHYLQKLQVLFPRFQAELDRLPFEDGQFDCAIFNASFHYSEDYAQTLREALRCVRKGGHVIIADSPWYAKDESGRQMLRERRAAFQQQYGFPSDGLSSQEYLTDERLNQLEKLFGIRWQVHHPNYGLRWAMRPIVARLNGKREPSSFRIYAARVAKP
jgi:SAM-dependent methyltransferase